jgi:hypothetical protein
MKSDRLGQPSTPRAGLSGRNDDPSSMISLKTLAARVESTAPAAREPQLDDSGMIDLKKLMAKASNAAPSPEPLAPGLCPDGGLFALPEQTLTPQVMAAEMQSNEAQPTAIGGKGKWLAGAIVMTMATAGVMVALHARSKQVPQVQTAVAAAARAAAAEPRQFVEAPKAQEPPQSAAIAPPKVDEPKAGGAPPVVAQRNRRVVKSPAQQDPTRQDAATGKPKTEVKPPPSEPCDLMCEIQRAAARKKQKK